MKLKTRKEVIEGLKGVLAKLEQLPELPMTADRFQFVDYCFSKADIVAKMRAIGGSWTKEIISPDKEYSQIHMIHKTLPIYLVISRDKVCKKILTYECEPMFSPEEETELELVNG